MDDQQKKQVPAQSEDDIGGGLLWKSAGKRAQSKPPVTPDAEDEFAVADTPQPAPQPSHTAEDLGGMVHRKKQTTPTQGRQTPVRYRKQQQKSQSGSAGTVILIVIVVFVLLLGTLIGVGIAMNQRADVLNGNTASDKAAIASDSGHFQKDGEADLSAEGVKGTMLEAYFTKDKRMAVKVSLGNGTATVQTISKVDVKIINENEEIVAQGTVTDIDMALASGARDTTTLYLDTKSILLPDDDLQQLGCTLTITSEQQK